MVDYRRIRTGPRFRDRIEPGEVLAMHRATQAFIEAELVRTHSFQRLPLSRREIVHPVVQS